MHSQTPLRLIVKTRSQFSSVHSAVGAWLPLDAGVVERTVEPTMLLLDRSHDRLHVGRDGDVALDEHPLPSGLLDQAQRFLAALGYDVGNGDNCAFARRPVQRPDRSQIRPP
jgi:hypothetical protein